MATFLCSRPYPLLLPPIIDKTRASNPLLQQNCFSFSTQKTFLRGTIGVTRSGFKPDLFTDPDSAGGFVGEMFGRFEGILYTIADAAVSSSDSVNGSKQSSDWLSGITNIMETVLKVLKDGLSAFHVPYAYGFAIILLTVLVKIATFPLSKKQVESAMAMRSLQPQVKAIQQRYAGDQERIQLETARLYKLARVNPLAGCLPTLATIPVWIGLYRALSNVADEGLLTEGFFWIPSLSGPTTIAARQSGSGVSWLFPFVDGHPPLGWSDTLAYLVLPVLLVISQYISVQIMQSSQGNDPNLKSSQALTKFLPLMIGYFSLSVPSGLSLYWFTNNILSTAQQIWLQKLGGATNPVRQFSDETILEEKSKIKTSVLKVDSPKIKAEQGDKLTSGELRPGERFRRIKEQEAMKRKQREEEKMKAEEATKQTKIINEEQKKKANLIKTEDERAESAIVDGVDEITHSVSSMHDSSNNAVSHLNGGYSTPVSKEDHDKMPVPRMENGRLGGSSEVDEKVEQHSYETLEKESVETYTTTTATDNKVSSEEAHDERREQPSGRDEA